MSFCFPSWSTSFSPNFHEEAKSTLEAALNKGNKPAVIEGRIEVCELSMGTQPPTLTLLEIGDLSLERFRGIFRLNYEGDAWLEVRCRVQANPLSHNPHLSRPSTIPLSTPLLASQPLLVPMTLRLSLLQLRAILILVVSASKGITLVFKNDPLQNVDVSSTFDSIEVIRGYLQQEIEGQLREMFREDLPGIIHRLSQKWFTETGMGGKVELPYRNEVIPINGVVDVDDVTDEEREAQEREIFPPYHPPSRSESGVSPTRKNRQGSLRSSVLRKTSIATTVVAESPNGYTTFPDIENYDPTYGLRPEGIPAHTGYEAFGRLWEKAREGRGKGLGSLMEMREGGGIGSVSSRVEDEEEDDEDDVGDVSDGDASDDGRRSFDLVDMATALPGRSISSRAGGSIRPPPASSIAGRSVRSRALPPDEDIVEWETLPAVGGGTISRPRIFHVQSQIRAPSDAGGPGGYMPSPSGTIGTAAGGSITARASSVRSSIGGSTLGVGMAASLAGSAGPGYRDAARAQALTTLSGGKKAKGGQALADLFAPSQAHRPGLGRRQSRAESVPTNVGSFRPQPSRLGTSNSVVHQAAAARASSSSMATTSAGPSRSATHSTKATSQHPPSRPASIVSMPIQMNTTPPRARRLSASFQPFPSGASPPKSSWPPRVSGIVLPLNDSVSQLATLSHSNHTLSPYGRSHEHVAVRSFPHLSRSNSLLGAGSPLAYSSFTSANAGPDHKKIKAKRKRIFKLGGGEKPSVEDNEADVFFDGPDHYGQEAETSSSGRDSGHSIARGLELRRPVAPKRTSYGFPGEERH